VSRGSFTSVARARRLAQRPQLVTNPALVVPSLLFPLFFFTAFAGGLSRVDSIPGFDYAAGYTTWIYGFVLLQAARSAACSRASRSRATSSRASRAGSCSGPEPRRHRRRLLAVRLVRAATTIAVITIVALIAGLRSRRRHRPVGLYALAFL
jgi:ABC-2 type transport system permease protein